jgi:putative ABC transport system permease protein
MVEIRLRKVLRDVWFERGRVALMATAIAASLVAGMTVLGARSILVREMAVNYLGTTPASATLEFARPVESGLIEAIRTRPGVADAEARDMVLGRANVGDTWISLLLFVVDDFDSVRLNTWRQAARISIRDALAHV